MCRDPDDRCMMTSVISGCHHFLLELEFIIEVLEVIDEKYFWYWIFTCMKFTEQTFN